MPLDHVTYRKTQAQSLSALDHVIALGDLNGQLEAFPLSCKVDELSPATLRYYRQELKAFVRFYHQLKINNPKDPTAYHVTLHTAGWHARAEAAADENSSEKRRTDAEPG